MDDRVAIIGAGFSGLSRACFLAKDGFSVTVLEEKMRPPTAGRGNLKLQASHSTWSQVGTGCPMSSKSFSVILEKISRTFAG
ncbi:MAG TPA: FAD-dependent oxidoreductase [Chryseolinea sp.]|nr:FAD-dependent oxidoreductase [Chryseolinea sp.]